MRTLRQGKWIAAVASCAFAAGCGSGHLAPRGPFGDAEQLLSQRAITAQPAGSPQRALVSWWRDAQYADRPGFLRMLAPAARARFEQRRYLDHDLIVFAAFIRLARPHVDRVRRVGDRAIVSTTIGFRTPEGGTQFVTSNRSETFSLVRRHGRWGIADTAFFDTFVPATPG
jgi:hypothetical protein